MKRINIYAFLVLLVLFAGCGDNGTGVSPGAFSLAITPAKNTLNVGGELWLTVEVNSVNKLFAASLDIAFDQTIIAADSVCAVPSGILGADAMISQLQQTSAGISLGIGRLQTSAADAVSGTGDLIRIRFRARAPGSTSVAVDRAMIVDESGQENSHLDDLQFKEAMITVRESSQR